MTQTAIFDPLGPPILSRRLPVARRRHLALRVGAYVVAILASLAVGPALFIALDRTMIAGWSGALLDLVGSP